MLTLRPGAFVEVIFSLCRVCVWITQAFFMCRVMLSTFSCGLCARPLLITPPGLPAQSGHRPSPAREKQVLVFQACPLSGSRGRLLFGFSVYFS